MTDNFDQKLLHVLICPVSAGPLDYDEENQELISDNAGLAYPIRNGCLLYTSPSPRDRG